jgi:hypothetical protein
MRAIQKIGLCDWRLLLVTRHAVIVERLTMRAWNVFVTACRLQGGDWYANKALCFYDGILFGGEKTNSHPVILNVPRFTI